VAANCPRKPGDCRISGGLTRCRPAAVSAYPPFDKARRETRL
jgi:hypothetical protein